MYKEKLEAVEIEVNHNCNRACSYCPNSQHERIEKGEMSPRLYETIMQQLQDIGFKGRISYSFYNEPLLCSNLSQFVKMTKSYLPDCRTVLYSNGTLLDYKKFQELARCGMDEFIITKHEGVGDFVFDETYASLSVAEKKKVNFQTHDDLTLTNRGGSLEGVGEKVLPKLLPCYVPSFMLTISVKGNVVPCFEDFFQENVMGNVEERHLQEIWQDEKYQEMRRRLRKFQRHQYSPCDKCNRYQVMNNEKGA